MPHFREFIDPNFLCNLDFLDDNGTYQRKTVTITGVTKEEIHNGKGGSELVATVHLAETKPFVLSKKNLKTLVRITRKINTDAWKGVRIELFIAENQKAFGNIFDVIRVTEKLPAPAKTIDYSQQEKMLRECKTITDLQTIYTGFSVDQKNGTVSVKEEMKAKLTPKAV